MRKESEVGMDYDDAEDILPAETGPRKVNARYAKTSFCEDKEAMKFVSASNAVNQPGNSISYVKNTESTEGGDVDRNGDDCCLCGMDGNLLCCDGCPSAYHTRCIGVMKVQIPGGSWLNVDKDEFHLKYYNQNDIPKVIQVLYESMQHRPIYYGICMAVLRYWSIPENFLPLSVSAGINVNPTNIKEEAKFSTSLLPPLSEDNQKPVSLVKGEYPPTDSDNMVPQLDASSVITQSPAPESSDNASSKECPTVDMKLPEETRTESVISAGSGSVSVSHQSDIHYHNSVNMSTAADPAKCSLVNSWFSNNGHANDMGLPMNFSLQTKENTQGGFGKCELNVTSDFGYMGSSYKPLSYINYYMHGDFAASAAAKLAILSSEESRSEGHVSDNQRKTASAITYLQAKAFSLTASRFFWPSSEKKLVEVPRERCGWCFSCKAPVSSKRGCMLNHAVISATKSATKILAGFSPLRSGEGILPSIATYIIYMEECLHGLIVGPFLNASYRKQWRKQVEQATTFSAIKPLLLKLEENIRIIAFSGDWVKLMDDWSVEFPMIQSAASTLGTTQKRPPSGRRYKKRSSVDEATTDGCHENFVWWRGGRFAKFIFQKATLPKSMVRKAARQGGLKKIAGIFYADGSEIPKRSRQLVWRFAVQLSRNASQLALQVRYLDFYLRWSDLIRPEQNIQDGKGQETEASVFRNANICDTRFVEGKSCYGIAFGSQKHLPSRVMKNVVEIEQGAEGKEKYWFSETRIPLYLIKEYEEANEKVSCDEEHYSDAFPLHRRRLKVTCKNIFYYLTCKRDNLDIFSCSGCQMDVSIRYAHRCGACQVSTNKEFGYMTTCKQCYHAMLLAPKGTNNESPTSPLLLQGRENGSGTVSNGPRTKASHPDMKQATSVTVLKGPRPKRHDQTPKTTRIKNSHPGTKQVASDSAKSRRKNCSWGLIWKKKGNEDIDINFRTKNILLKGGSGMPQSCLEPPVCHLCRKPYRSDLMYIRCETCQNWYHAEAVELEESKILDLLGFKCCKCRRIKSPVCPYFEPKEGKKSHTRASKKEHSGADSDSGTFTDMKEREPATPVFPVEDDPLLFSLSSVELITEPKLDVDAEWNTVSVPGLQKLPVRRHVKREGDGDGSVGGIPLDAEFSTHNEAGNLSKSADSLSPLEYDPAMHFDSNLLNNSESLNYECMEFEPHTYFSLTELLHPDDGSQFEGVDVSGDLSGYLGSSGTLVPEKCGGVSSIDKSEPAISLQDSDYSCQKCSQMDPVPDLCCKFCGILFHSQCSPWVESPSGLGNWRCGNCREWQ
ncbi:Zinc finger, PHD-type [Sesbania bispinosa]|nr:Zinc finger, PHD-type [Sesbania bispinosa]